MFNNSNIFGPCIIHILYTGCAKIKKNNPGTRRLSRHYVLEKRAGVLLACGKPIYITAVILNVRGLGGIHTVSTFMAVFRAGFCDPSVDTNVWCGNRVALLGIFMVYLCAVQSICLSSHSACFTYGTGELIVVTFCVESLLQALCCRLSDAAVCEFQLLVELYEHYYQRLVKRKEELYLTLPVELIETANLTCFSH